MDNDSYKKRPKSRSEQAPGSGFHPCDKSDNLDYEILVSCGSYELLVSNVDNKTKEKVKIQNNLSYF